jgi:hypothetical protein
MTLTISQISYDGIDNDLWTDVDGCGRGLIENTALRGVAEENNENFNRYLCRDSNRDIIHKTAFTELISSECATVYRGMCLMWTVVYVRQI